MIINPTINLTGVPLALQPGFTAAVNAACSFYDQLFSNPVTLNITFTYGPSGGSAQNYAVGGYLNYSSVNADLSAIAQSPSGSVDQKTAVNTLPAGDPTGGGTFFVTKAQAEAWGLPATGPTALQGLSSFGQVPAGADGIVTLANNQTWDFTGNRSTGNSAALDPIGTLEHEISEVMGRNGIEGTGNLIYNTNGNTYTALDLFRYVQTGTGVQQTLTPGPGSFSLDGKTLLLPYNDPTVIGANGKPQGGDLTDWASYSPGQGGPIGDSYGQPKFATPSLVSKVDIREMNVIGWQVATQNVAGALGLYANNPIKNFGITVVDSAANVSQNMDALQTLAANGDIGSITFNDFIPTLSVKNYQLYDAAVFPLITGQYHLSIDLGAIPVTFALPGNVPYVTLTGSADATLVGNSLNDVFNIEAQGNHTIKAGGTGSYTITGNTGTTTLDYSSVSGYLTVDVATGTVTKPSGGNTFTATDSFAGSSAVAVFDGGSGINTFKSVATGYYTFNGKGVSNTLDYSADHDGITVDLTSNTVSKDIRYFTWSGAHYWQDSFSDIQTFIGGGAGSTDFKSIATGGYTFNGKGSSNTLDYSADTNGLTIDLTSNTVSKDIAYFTLKSGAHYWQDSFSDIQTFIGGGAGNTDFKSIATGSYTFTGNGAGNTLDYSADADGVTINLGNDTVSKDIRYFTWSGAHFWQDSFSDIQNFVGNASAHDTVVFDGASSQYSIIDNANGVTVTDTVAGRDGTVQLSQIDSLQFTDKAEDLTSHMMWRNGSGTTTIWQLDGGAKVADDTLGAIPTDWSFQATGDFNGDGHSDILWRNTSGQTVLWEMNGGTKIADVNLNTITTDWHVEGTGDFFGTGRSGDILWRNDNGQTVLWEMNGGTKVADLNLDTITTDWHIQGIGDFNGDGKSDILWRNTNGQTVLWEMNGGTKIADVNLNTITTDWHVEGTGDFFGAGRSGDILWRNDNGQTVLWEMNGGTKVADVNLNVISNDWHIAGVVDLNGDGHSDIVWHNDNGQTVAWEINGGAKVADVNLPFVTSDWALQFHHFDVV